MEEQEKPSSRASSSSAPAPGAPPPPAPAAAPATVPAPTPPSSSKVLESAPTGPRQRFFVELRPGETTIVSWKRLLKDSNKAVRPPPSSELPSGAHPALESRIAPVPAPAGQAAESELKDALAPNRFSAVIEKIERLYKGQQSSDEEELDGVPDDDEYDTEDSFIDDAELDEYFQVDKFATKHNGFFINRGKLERINESISSPNHAPKKRRRKDNEMDGGHMPNKHLKMGNVRMKAAARNASFVGKKSSSPSKVSAPISKHHQEGKSLQNRFNAHAGPSKRQSLVSSSKSEHSSVKLSNKEPSFLPMEGKDMEMQNAGVIYSRDPAKLKATSTSTDAMYPACHDKVVSFQAEDKCRKVLNDTNEKETSNKVRHRDRNGSSMLPDLNSSGSKHTLQTPKPLSTPGKEGSGVRPKGTMLERAIRDLQQIVAESRPPTMEIPEADSSAQGVKRRLPREVKQKLAKVARLAQSSQGRISEELVNRLMSILGHLVQVKTLKRNLKEMVELGLSAKQQKDDRFQQIKKEVIEMIRMRATSSKSKAAEQQDGSSDDFQELPGKGIDEKGLFGGRYSMDDAMEDKICDLYDLYVEGMDEDKGPQIRKLYVELAELWPNGSMDNTGIKSAVNRAKKRKRARALYLRRKEEEKVKRKKLSSAIKTEEIARVESNSHAQPRAAQEKLAVDPSYHAFVSSEWPFSNISTGHHLATLSGTFNPSMSFSLDRPKHEKIKGSMIVDEAGRAMDAAIFKKKVKIKPELDMGVVHVHQGKQSSTSQHEKETHKSHKLATSPPHTSGVQSAVLPDSEELS